MCSKTHGFRERARGSGKGKATPPVSGELFLVSNGAEVLQETCQRKPLTLELSNLVASGCAHVLWVPGNSLLLGRNEVLGQISYPLESV